MGNFIRPSFEPISSVGEHAALCHYTSSPETDVELEEGKVFLTDTGAGFYEGSTDVTRTYAMGELPQEVKDHFTLVAISNLPLANAKFLHGCVGMNLDIIARKPFWDRNLNFNHGTGHGVGYLLNIHEGPTGFRWTYRAHEIHPFEAGMVITDEPGIYIEGSHGVRLENELLVCNGEQNEYGQFMYFEPITFIPMDLDAINPEIMTAEDKMLLNNYHKQVFEKVSPYLNEEETEWLKKYTREI
jgi:Xaa-Pro aminopeptidase